MVRHLTYNSSCQALLSSQFSATHFPSLLFAFPPYSYHIFVQTQASSEAEETLKRIQSHRGVTGILIVNKDGVPVGVLFVSPFVAVQLSCYPTWKLTCSLHVCIYISLVNFIVSFLYLWQLFIVEKCYSFFQLCRSFNYIPLQIKSTLSAEDTVQYAALITQVRHYSPSPWTYQMILLAYSFLSFLSLIFVLFFYFLYYWKLASKARSVIRTLDPQNDITFLRVRSKKHEIMVAPDKDYLLFVIQNPNSEEESSA